MIDELLPKLELETEEPKYRLIRRRDKLVKESARVAWIEWNKDGTFKDKHDTPKVGRSLLMSPFNQFYTWQCTPVTEIIEELVDSVKFKTQNSNYELFKL